MTAPDARYDPRDWTGEFDLDQFAAINEDALLSGRVNSEGLRRVLAFLYGQQIERPTEPTDTEPAPDDRQPAPDGPDVVASGNPLSATDSPVQTTTGTPGTPSRKGK